VPRRWRCPDEVIVGLPSAGRKDGFALTGRQRFLQGRSAAMLVMTE
jgi:hypothetical protein